MSLSLDDFFNPKPKPKPKKKKRVRGAKRVKIEYPKRITVKKRVTKKKEPWSKLSMYHRQKERIVRTGGVRDHYNPYKILGMKHPKTKAKLKELDLKIKKLKI